MVKRISHIGILVDDMDAAIEFWTNTVGLKKFREMEVDVEGLRSVFLSVDGTGDEMAIELLQPMDKSDMNNAVARRLANKGDGFYHICVEVDDIENSAKPYADRGISLMHRPPVTEQDAPRWLVHPKDANGVMIEGLQP